MPASLLAAIERNRKRLWALCYRMTGSRVDADDLTQEAIARAIERAGQLTAEDPTGWLLHLTTTLCLDHLRRARVRRRATQLVDPLDGDAWRALETVERTPENDLVLREDVRFAVIVALQSLSRKQRAALILRDVCGRSLDEVATVLGTNANAVKATLHRARSALSKARHHVDVDVPVDEAVVARFAGAVHAGSIERITELLADDVWGLVDGGGVVQTSSKPSFGRRAVSRQWQNAKRRLGVAVVAEIRHLNGQAAIVVRLAEAEAVVVAVVHIETRAGQVAALRIDRDPQRTVLASPVLEPRHSREARG